jgi:hypothetical protein
LDIFLNPCLQYILLVQIDIELVTLDLDSFRSELVGVGRRKQKLCGGKNAHTPHIDLAAGKWRNIYIDVWMKRF